MTATLTFVVPGVPIPCARARVMRPRGQKVRAMTPARTRSYEANVALVARAAAIRVRWSGSAPATYKLTIDVYRPARRGDWDNYGKGVCDALTKAGIWADDRYVDDARVRLFVDKAYPRVEVLVVQVPS